MTDMHHMSYLEAVSAEDLTEVRRKEASYRGSWKRRGGVGAFMMLARKWDRLEAILAGRQARQYDILFDAGDGSDGTPLAEVRDLRRYLLLVEAELVAGRAPRVPRFETPPMTRDMSLRNEITEFKPCVVENQELGLTIYVHEDVACAAHPIAAPDGSKVHYVDALLAMDDGRLVGVNFWRALTQQAPSASVGATIPPGTPEDGGHHAPRAEVGGRMEDGYMYTPAWPSVFVRHPTGQKYYNVDRTKYARDEVEHLPVLAQELNHKEYQGTPPEYQGMYEWVEGEVKWRLAAPYREHWGYEAS